MSSSTEKPIVDDLNWHDVSDHGQTSVENDDQSDFGDVDRSRPENDDRQGGSVRGQKNFGAHIRPPVRYGGEHNILYHEPPFVLGNKFSKLKNQIKSHNFFFRETGQRDNYHRQSSETLRFY